MTTEEPDEKVVLDAVRKDLDEQETPAARLPAQEPVVYINLGLWSDGSYWPDDCFSDKPADGFVPLYAAPPAARLTDIPPESSTGTGGEPAVVPKSTEKPPAARLTPEQVYEAMRLLEEARTYLSGYGEREIGAAIDAYLAKAAL